MADRGLVVVTGAFGFVGAALVRRLSADPSLSVIALDDRSGGQRRVGGHRVDVREGSTADVARLIPERPDLIFHLGEYSRVEQSWEDVDAVWKSNVIGTTSILEYCRARRIPLVYSASSTRFVSDPGVTPEGLSPYSCSKDANARMISQWASWFSFGFAICYLYNVFGPGETEEGKYATVIGRLKRASERGERVSVTSPGTQRRNFTYIDDAVSGLVLAATALDGVERQFGNPIDYSVLEAAGFFGVEVNLVAPRRGNRMRTAPPNNGAMGDVTQARHLDTR